MSERKKRKSKSMSVKGHSCPSPSPACHKLKVETFQKLSLIITHKLIRKCFLTFSLTDGGRRGEKKTEAKPQN